MENEISLIDILKVLNKYKFLLAGLVVFLMVAVGLFSFFQPKEYQATATILPLGTSGGGSLASLLSEIPFGGGGVSGMMGSSNLMSVLKSRILAEMVREEICLQQGIVINKEALNKGDFSKINSEAMKLLNWKMEVKSGKESALAVSVTAVSAEVAAEVANTYVRKLGEYLIKHPSLNISFQSLDPAVPSQWPSNHGRTKKLVLLAGIAALFMGVMLAFALEYWQALKQELKKIPTSKNGG